MPEYTKKQAREAVQGRLEALTQKEYEEKSSAIYKNVCTFLDEQTPQSVLLYVSSSKWREVDLSTLERQYRGIRFECVPSRADAPFPDGPFDVVFVPLYGFRQDGYRLGHGSGWYDRFLKTQPHAVKVGVGLEAGRIDFPVEAHDIPMGRIITEAKC